MFSQITKIYLLNIYLIFTNYFLLKHDTQNSLLHSAIQILKTASLEINSLRETSALRKFSDKFKNKKNLVKMII